MTARPLARIMAVLASAAVPCVLVELVLRALAPPADTPGLFVKTSSAMEYGGRPHAQGLWTGAPVNLNGLGLRDRDHPTQPADDTIRIIALGDSFTFGAGVKEEQTFPRVAETLLNGSRGRRGHSVEVLNFGVPGYNTLHELAQLRQTGLALHPDVVVLGFLYNDLDITPEQRDRLAGGAGSGPDGLVRRLPAPQTSRPDGTTTTAGPLNSPKRLVASGINNSLEWLKRRSMFFAWFSPRAAVLLRWLGVKGIGGSGEINEQFVDSNPDWKLIRSTLLDMKRLCDENGIRFVIAIIPAMTKFGDSEYPLTAYHEAVSEFCRSSSIDYLDLLPAFRGRNGGPHLWISPIDPHPNAEAQRIIGEALAKFLAPALHDIHHVSSR